MIFPFFGDVLEVRSPLFLDSAQRIARICHLNCSHGAMRCQLRSEIVWLPNAAVRHMNYMNSQKKTREIKRLKKREWFPSLTTWAREFWNIGVLGYPILRHTELKLFDLCPKAAGTSIGNFGPWPRAIGPHPVPWKWRSPLPRTRPSSGFGTSVMFRNPSWVVYRKPLRSSFCTCLALSMSCDVVCRFSAHPADSHKLPWPSEGFGHRMSKGHKHRPAGGLRISCDQRRLRTRQVQLAAAQPLFCSSLSIAIEKDWALASVKCAWWCGEMWWCTKGRLLRVFCVWWWPSWNLLSTAVDSGEWGGAD